MRIDDRQKRGTDRCLSPLFNGCLSLIFLLMMPMMAHADITTGLVGHWSFDEATAQDKSENNNDGLLQGNVNFIDGKISKSAQFDGLSGIEFGSATTVDSIFANGGSISFWLNPFDLGGSINGHIINKIDTTLSNGFVVFINKNNHSLRLIQAFSNAPGIWETPANSIQLNQWQHIGITYNASSLNNAPTIFLNGVSQSITKVNLPNGAYRDDKDQILMMANRPLTLDRGFIGGMDEFRVYKRLLSGEDVKELYEQIQNAPVVEVPVVEPLPVETPSSSLVFHLNFDKDDFLTTQSDAYKTMRFADQSMQGNQIDCQSAFLINSMSNNQCPSQTSGPDTSQAAHFSGAGNNICDMQADYLAVTKHSFMDRLPKGSISFWAAFDNNNDYVFRVLDTLKQFAPGTWQIHRDGDLFLTLTVNNDAGAETDLLTFPGATTALGRWNHYSLTWDGTVMKGYYNGVYFGQASMKGFSYLGIAEGDYLVIGALKHNQIRNSLDGGNCVNEYKAPAGSYVFPNAGYFDGSLDDIRIYNRALSNSEVTDIFNQAHLISKEYLLRLSKSGTGSGGVSGGGISCGKHCAESIAPGTSVTLTASASAGSIFTGWSGACSGTSSTCTVTMDGHKDIGAVFDSQLPVVDSFEAEAGSVSSPFILKGGVIYQTFGITGDNPLDGGKAAYSFKLAQAGNYLVSAQVNASSQAANSFYVNIDAEPSSSMTWHMSTTAGFEERFVSWGGSTSGGNPAKVFNLGAGDHTLVIRGREGEVYLDSITIKQKVNNWYVDVNASCLSCTGTSWAQAWKNFASIDWSKIQATDVLHISGGVYNETLTISKSGNVFAPIVIKASQEEGHNSPVVINGAINIGANWVTIDGAKSDAYLSMIGQKINNIVYMRDNPNLLKDNINLKVLKGINIWSGYSQGQKLFWVDITNADLEDAHGIRMNPDPNHVSDVELAYLWIHGVGQDAITLLSNAAASWDNFNVHHSLLEDMGDDGLEIAGGSSIHHNVIRHSRFARGHPDGIQSSNNYNRFYNNIIYDFGSSLIITQGQAAEGGDYGHIHIYGNLLYKKDVPVSTTELEFKWFPASLAWKRDTVYYRDWVIANNTFAYLNAGGMSFQARPELISNVHVRDVVIKNNLFYKFTNNIFGIPYPKYTDPSNGLTTTWDWSQKDVAFDYNAAVYKVTGANHIGYYGVSFMSMNDLNAATIYKHNAGLETGLGNPGDFDFSLSKTDTTLKNKGEDLSPLGMPDLNMDITGQPRGQEGSWDIGAFEASLLDSSLSGSGDVSLDGKVTMCDAALVLRFTLDSALNDEQKKQADINADGKIDGADVVAIARKALGV